MRGISGNALNRVTAANTEGPHNALALTSSLLVRWETKSKETFKGRWLRLGTKKGKCRSRATTPTVVLESRELPAGCSGTSPSPLKTVPSWGREEQTLRLDPCQPLPPQPVIICSYLGPLGPFSLLILLLKDKLLTPCT